MGALAAALECAARRAGAAFRYDSTVTEVLVERGRAGGVQLAGGEAVRARTVIANADPAALAAGRLGADAARAVGGYSAANRSLSAMLWLIETERANWPLARHNVFFSGDYPAEFRAYHAARLPDAPSLYVCALDREAGASPGASERLQIILNAPAIG